MHRQRDRKLDFAQTLISLGELELTMPDLDSAGARFREAAALAQECDAPHAAAEAALGLAAVAVRGRGTAAAEQHLSEAERLSRGRGLIVPMILERSAEVAGSQELRMERAAELLAVACVLRKEAGMPLPPVALSQGGATWHCSAPGSVVVRWLRHGRGASGTHRQMSSPGQRNSARTTPQVCFMRARIMSRVSSDISRSGCAAEAWTRTWSISSSSVAVANKPGQSTPESAHRRENGTAKSSR